MGPRQQAELICAAHRWRGADCACIRDTRTRAKQDNMDRHPVLGGAGSRGKDKAPKVTSGNTRDQVRGRSVNAACDLHPRQAHYANYVASLGQTHSTWRSQ